MFSGIFRKSFSIPVKTFLYLVGLSLLALFLSSLIAFKYIALLGDHALDSGSSLGKRATDESRAALEAMGQQIIEQKARDVAKQVEIYLQSRPNMTVKTLQADSEFRNIAVQPVGKTGYTAIVDGVELVILVHKFPAYEGMDLGVLKTKLPSFWRVIEPSVGGKASSGYYDWKEPDGRINKKYAYIAPINASMADGRKGLTLWATTYIAEFSEPANNAERAIDKSIAATAAFIKKQKTLMGSSIIAASFVIIFLVLWLAYRFSKRITQPILAIKDGASIVGAGNLDYQFDVKTGDELEELANTFNKMTRDLKTYMTHLKETTEEKERIEADLKIAHDIQVSMLPATFPPFPERNEFDIFAYMKPARDVGGDFYDIFFVDEDRLCFLIGDVSGKGVPAALFMTITKVLLKGEAMRTTSIVDALYNVNNIISAENDLCMFVTILCALLDTRTGDIEICSAGHNQPLLLKGNRDCAFLPVSENVVLGPFADMRFESRRLTLEPEDVILFYTDGVTEAFNPHNEEFSPERLHQILSSIQDSSVDGIIRGVNGAITAFAREAPQSDDITLMALKFHGGYLANA